MQLHDLNAFLQKTTDSVIRSNVLNDTLNALQSLNVTLEKEFLLTVQEKQINELLSRYVTHNVKAIQEMRIECHDDWFRFYCTVNVFGVYASVASNFRLVHIQLDRQRQRLVFAQTSDTEILELYCQNYIHKLLIHYGVPLYRKYTGQDPLGLILEKTGLARIKENVFYIDIGRWLREDKSIMNKLYKMQVNYATVSPEQLVLQAKANPRDFLATTDHGDIITQADSGNSI